MRWTRIATITVIAPLLVFGAAAAYLTQPIRAVGVTPPKRRAESERLRVDVKNMVRTFAPRIADSENLDRASEFIAGRLKELGIEVGFQSFEVGGLNYRNVIAHVGPAAGERVVVGAHYDAAEPGVGADDNASGVAGLLELARLFAQEPPPKRVDLVAFALEEPPYFRTAGMGSAVHARGLQREGALVRAMISLEMIGYFKDRENSQGFPLAALRHLYGSRGDFVAVIAGVGQEGLVRRIKSAMAGATSLPVKSMNAPRAIPGIDFSDQLNYWDAGFPAVMITDTSFYRNPNYHQATDTEQTLDYSRMAQVVDGVAAAVKALANEK